MKQTQSDRVGQWLDESVKAFKDAAKEAAPMTTKPEASATAVFTVGELKSHNPAAQKFRIGKSDEVAASCREWKVALLGDNPPHPAALTLMAAASMIDDMAAIISSQEHELQMWAAFAKQSSERSAIHADTLSALKAIVAALSQPAQRTDLTNADRSRLAGVIQILRGDAVFAVNTALSAISKATEGRV